MPSKVDTKNSKVSDVMRAYLKIALELSRRALGVQQFNINLQSSQWYPVYNDARPNLRPCRISSMELGTVLFQCHLRRSRPPSRKARRSWHIRSNDRLLSSLKRGYEVSIPYYKSHCSHWKCMYTSSSSYSCRSPRRATLRSETSGGTPYRDRSKEESV